MVFNNRDIEYGYYSLGYTFALLQDDFRLLTKYSKCALLLLLSFKKKGQMMQNNPSI